MGEAAGIFLESLADVSGPSSAFRKGDVCEQGYSRFKVYAKLRIVQTTKFGVSSRRRLVLLLRLKPVLGLRLGFELFLLKHLPIPVA